MSYGAAAWPLYRLAGRSLVPLAAPYLAGRARRGREDPARVDEKRGIATAPAFADRPIWLHAVSVGESAAVLPLAEALLTAGAAVVFTSATPAAAARVAPSCGPRLVHQYAPLDLPPFVARFVAHWRPRAALFTEAEVWPATLHRLQRAGIPRLHVNARISERSFARWSSRPALARPLFSAIDLALAQSSTHAERFARLGTRRTLAVGNLKFDAPPPAVDAVRLAELRRTAGPRPVWLAASTHPGEEELVLAAHDAVRERLPDVLTVIAPRHADRGAEIAALASGSAARSVTRRAAGEGPAGAVYVADTYGELGTLFAFADAVFLGGSLVPIGGHNPAEPASHGVALMTGPWHGEMFEPLLSRGAARLVGDDRELAGRVVELLSDDEGREALGARARKVVQDERGALRRTLEAIKPYLADPAPSSADASANVPVR